MPSRQAGGKNHQDASLQLGQQNSQNAHPKKEIIEGGSDSFQD